MITSFWSSFYGVDGVVGTYSATGRQIGTGIGAGLLLLK